MYLVTADEMRRADRKVSESYGIPSLTLMENAGSRIFEILEKKFSPEERKNIVIMIGKGNNGGDGLVVARRIHGAGGEVRVLSLFPRESLSPDAQIQWDRFAESGGQVLPYKKENLVGATLIVDALLGIGLSQEVRSPFREAIQDVNTQAEHGTPVLAIDLPSGLSADTGKPLGIVIRARRTVALAAPKVGLVQAQAEPYVGELDIVDIGIPEKVYSELGVMRHWVSERDIKPSFKPRDKESHKGTHGHVLLVGGSESKPGAILLAGRAALRTGSGLVTVALPDKAFRKFPRKFLELMYEPLSSTKEGILSRKNFGQILKLLGGKSALGIGPALGVRQDILKLVTEVVRKSPVPAVLDADALSVFKEAKNFPKSKAPLVLTPHPGEMSRLTKTPTPASFEGRLEVATKFAVQNGVIVVLKGYRTVTALPDGHVFINSTGNPAMATAGMGDILAGVITSLIGQGLSPDQAAIAGVFIHGRAGDRVAERLGDRGLLASDVIEEIPVVMKELISA